MDIKINCILRVLRLGQGPNSEGVFSRIQGFLEVCKWEFAYALKFIAHSLRKINGLINIV